MSSPFPSFVASTHLDKAGGSAMSASHRGPNTSEAGMRRGTRPGAGMADETTTIGEWKAAVRRFAAERHWEPYHSPKNLAVALACEVAELMEPMRWVTAEESRRLPDDPAMREALADEL